MRLKKIQILVKQAKKKWIDFLLPIALQTMHLVLITHHITKSTVGNKPSLNKAVKFDEHIFDLTKHIFWMYCEIIGTVLDFVVINLFLSKYVTFHCP